MLPAPGVDSWEFTSDAGTDGTYAIGDTIELTVTFEREVTVNDTVGTPFATLCIGGCFDANERMAPYDRGSGTAELVFAYTVQLGDPKTGVVSPSRAPLELNGGTIKSSGGHDAELVPFPVGDVRPGHKVDGVRPTLERAVTDLDGRAIRLTFSEDLSAPTAPASAFALSVASGSAPTISDATLSGNIVTLSLESALMRGQVPVVVYTDPTADVNDDAAVQDDAGNDADSFTTDSGGIPAVDDVVEFVVAADWALKPGDVTAGERFRLLFRTTTRRNASSGDIGIYNSFVQAAAAAGHTAIQAHSDAFRVLGSTATVDARDNTNTTYTSSDKGVPIYWLNGAKIADDYEDFYDGSWSNDGAGKNESGADHTNPLIGSGSAGTWTGSKSDGTAGENNQGQSRALGDSFVHFGTPLTSNSTLGAGAVGPFYGMSAVYRVEGTPDPAVNSAPVFGSGAAFSVAENQTAVGMVVAADDDAGDVVVYALTGGDDAALLEIGSSDGVLRFVAAPDHESPGDADGDNVYVVTVTATSGAGGRELTATQDVMVTVTDVDEVPVVRRWR